MSERPEPLGAHLPVVPPPRRFAAFGLDLLLLAAPVALLRGGAFLLVFGTLRPDAPGLAVWAVSVAAISLPVWCYFTFLEGGARHATFGKRWLWLTVGDVVGQPIGRGRALVRTAAKLFPLEVAHASLLLPEPVWAAAGGAERPGFVVSTLFVGAWLAMLLIGPRAQGVHDLIAGTRVLPAAT